MDKVTLDIKKGKAVVTGDSPLAQVFKAAGKVSIRVKGRRQEVEIVK